MPAPGTNSPENFMRTGGDRLRIAFGVGGLIAIVLGLIIMFFPVQSGAVTMQVVAGMMALYALVVGIVYIGSAVFARNDDGWTRAGHIGLGVLYLIAGIIVLFNLGATAAVLAVFLSVTIGVLWLLEGIVAFSTVSRAANKVWTIIYGVVSAIAGLVLIVSPLLAAVTLWLLLGISMVAIGIVQVVRAFRARRAA